MAALPTMLPVDEAAQKYGLDSSLIRSLVESGKIKGAMIGDEIIVSDSAVQDIREQAAKEPLCREDTPEWDPSFAEKAGNGLSISEATRAYGIPHQTIHRWMKSGFVKRLGTNKNRVLIDQGDVAYCARIYHTRNTKQGRRLFDKRGLPYKPKTGPLAG